MPEKARKIVDEEHVLDRRRGAKIRMEVWALRDGTVTRFNLAYVDAVSFAGDNGRVLGYDTAHGVSHRHFRGEVSSLGPTSYEHALDMFLGEVWVLRKESK